MAGRVLGVLPVVAFGADERCVSTEWNCLVRAGRFIGPVKDVVEYLVDVPVPRCSRDGVVILPLAPWVRTTIGSVVDVLEDEVDEG